MAENGCLWKHTGSTVSSTKTDYLELLKIFQNKLSHVRRGISTNLFGATLLNFSKPLKTPFHRAIKYSEEKNAAVFNLSSHRCFRLLSFFFFFFKMPSLLKAHFAFSYAPQKNLWNRPLWSYPKQWQRLKIWADSILPPGQHHHHHLSFTPPQRSSLCLSFHHLTSCRIQLPEEKSGFRHSLLPSNLFSHHMNICILLEMKQATKYS